MSGNPAELDAALQRLAAHADGDARVYMAAGDLYQSNYAQLAPVSVTRTLPRDVTAFTGRQAELDHLLALPAPALGPVIHAVNGMPGVGKTALATRAAHLLADRFPDGQLFVRLHAHTPDQRPADPADVLAALLSITGTPPKLLPAGLDARAALWRDRSSSKRLLLVLDDANDSTQVEPLLPATAGCLVLITSRRRLIALEGAVPLALQTLPPAQAAQLFAQLAHRGPAEPADAPALDETVRLCGCLPLAIALVGARLAHHPAWTLAQFTADFAQTQDRLEELAGDDRAVAAAFELSYRDLPPERQRLFRLLGVLPGEDFDAFATAALAAIPLAAARRHLDGLYTDNLVTESAPGRYRLHDLLRAYAQHLGTGDPASARDEAVERLHAYYQHVCEAADHHFARYTRTDPQAHSAPRTGLPDVTTYPQAISWMRTELPNLLACAQHSVTHQQYARAVRLTSALASFIRHEGPWHLAAALHHTAADAARRSNDRHGESDALHDEGRIRRLTGEFTEAIEVQKQALTLYRALKDRLGEANALRELGRIQYASDNYPEATRLLDQALALYRELDDQLGIANTLHELGRVRHATGDLTTAARLQQQALVMDRRLEHRIGEGGALNELGRVRRAAGNLHEAAELQRDALALFRDLGSRQGEANALREMGRIHHATGDPSTATAFLRQALILHRELGDRRGEANALREMGRIHHATGDTSTAASLLDQALVLYQDVSSRRGRAETLICIGALLTDTEGPQEGLALYDQALELARQAGSPLTEARALEGIADCAAQAGENHVASSHLHRAVGIYKSLSAADAKRAMTRLATLTAEES